jgi:hypothetical protein
LTAKTNPPGSVRTREGGNWKRRFDASIFPFLSLIYPYHDCCPDLYGLEIKPTFSLACVD